MHATIRERFFGGDLGHLLFRFGGDLLDLLFFQIVIYCRVEIKILDRFLRISRFLIALV